MHERDSGRQSRFFLPGVDMKKYEIVEINNQDYFCSVKIAEECPHNVKLGDMMVSGVLRIKKTIDLPINAAKKLKTGQNIFALQNKISKDYVYLYRDGVCLKVKPVSDDKYSCRYYMQDLPGIFNGFKLDRFVFKAVLFCECRRRNIRPSLIARRNLQKLVARQGFAELER